MELPHLDVVRTRLHSMTRFLLNPFQGLESRTCARMWLYHRHEAE